MSSPTKPTTTSIDDLPPEMICELFKHLHPIDLAACSMVNMRWHSIYAGFEMHRLVAANYRFFGKWYHSGRTIEDRQRCSLEIFSRLANKPLLSNLKHLTLFTIGVSFDLNQLNAFRQLVHLEISGLKART